MEHESGVLKKGAAVAMLATVLFGIGSYTIVGRPSETAAMLAICAGFAAIVLIGIGMRISRRLLPALLQGLTIYGLAALAAGALLLILRVPLGEHFWVKVFSLGFVIPSPNGMYSIGDLRWAWNIPIELTLIEVVIGIRVARIHMRFTNGVGESRALDDQ